MIRTIGDLLKLVVFVKSVPDTEPDADGEWVTLDVSACRLWPTTQWDYLSSILPKGNHAVAVRE